MSKTIDKLTQDKLESVDVMIGIDRLYNDGSTSQMKDIGESLAYTEYDTVRGGHRNIYIHERFAGLEDVVRAMIHHEHGHVAFTVMPKEAMTDPRKKAIHNMLEDIRLEHIIASIFPGMQPRFNEIVKSYFKLHTLDNDSKYLELFQGLMAIRFLQHQHYGNLNASHYENREIGECLDSVLQSNWFYRKAFENGILTIQKSVKQMTKSSVKKANKYYVEAVKKAFAIIDNDKSSQSQTFDRNGCPKIIILTDDDQISQDDSGEDIDLSEVEQIIDLRTKKPEQEDGEDIEPPQENSSSEASTTGDQEKEEDNTEDDSNEESNTDWDDLEKLQDTDIEGDKNKDKQKESDNPLGTEQDEEKAESGTEGEGQDKKEEGEEKVDGKSEESNKDSSKQTNSEDLDNDSKDDEPDNNGMDGQDDMESNSGEENKEAGGDTEGDQQESDSSDQSTTGGRGASSDPGEQDCTDEGTEIVDMDDLAKALEKKIKEQVDLMEVAVEDPSVLDMTKHINKAFKHVHGECGCHNTRANLYNIDTTKFRRKVPNTLSKVLFDGRRMIRVEKSGLRMDSAPITGGGKKFLQTKQDDFHFTIELCLDISGSVTNYPIIMKKEWEVAATLFETFRHVAKVKISVFSSQYYMIDKNVTKFPSISAFRNGGESAGTNLFESIATAIEDTQPYETYVFVAITDGQAFVPQADGINGFNGGRLYLKQIQKRNKYVIIAPVVPLGKYAELFGKYAIHVEKDLRSPGVLQDMINDFANLVIDLYRGVK